MKLLFLSYLFVVYKSNDLFDEFKIYEKLTGCVDLICLDYGRVKWKYKYLTQMKLRIVVAYVGSRGWVRQTEGGWLKS